MRLSSYLKLSILFALTTLVVQQNLSANRILGLDTIPPPTPKRPVIQEKRPSEVFFGGIREEMPLLPDCGDKPDYASRKKCSDSLLILFIYENFHYPYTAWQDSVEGMAVVSFSVEKDGTVSEARVVRDPGSGTGEEALRLVNQMNEWIARWIPGRQGGKPVRVQFNLPVKFKMADQESPPSPPPLPVVDEIFMVTRHVPGFPGCEDQGRGPRKRECQEKMLQRFIYDNLVYPELAKKKKREGTVVVGFYVETDGIVNPQRIVENPGMGMGEEAMRLLELMNRKRIKWTVGNSYARHHRTLFHLSIDFRLSRKESISTPPTLVQIWEAPDTYPYVADTISIANSAFRINRIPALAPIFPGGEATLSAQKQQQYTSNQLREYFKANFHHQNTGVHLGSKGDFVLKFIVEKDGSVSTISVNRDPGGGIAAAAVRVVNRMIKEDMRWLPGSKDGYIIASEVSIPISLIPKGQEIHTPRKLQAAALQKKRNVRSSSSVPPPPPPPPPPSAKTGIVQLATMMKEPPLFPGCEDLSTYLEKQQCAVAKFEEFIQGNLRYPETALKRSVEGTVLVSFIVEKNGSVSKGKMLYDLGSGTGKEALRLVKLIGEKGLNFSPQQSGGRSMRVMYTLPVQFELE